MTSFFQAILVAIFVVGVPTAARLEGKQLRDEDGRRAPPQTHDHGVSRVKSDTFHAVPYGSNATLLSGETVHRRENTGSIIGGTNAQLGEFPYFVGWDYAGCGVSLIHGDFLLTAAHCTSNLKDVVIRAYNRADDWKYSGQNSISARITRVFRHLEYSDVTDEYDFKLFKIDKFITSVDPVAINCNGGDPVVGDDLVVIGFGTQVEGQPTYPNTLQKVTVDYVSNQQCNNDYWYYGGIDPQSMMCAQRAAKDSCQGDSGGPLVKIVNGKHTQVGVVSWGVGCARSNYPGVYSRVSHVSDWINEIIEKHSAQPKDLCASSSASCGNDNSYNIFINNNNGYKDCAWVATKSKNFKNNHCGKYKDVSYLCQDACNSCDYWEGRNYNLIDVVSKDGGDSSCEDEDDYDIWINNNLGYHDCAWVAGKNLNFRNRHCGKEKDVSYLCQETCDTCDFWDGRSYSLKNSVAKSDAGCEDLPGEIYINGKNGWQNCVWLASRNYWIDRLCSDAAVASTCQKTCEYC